jgi:hypothetical protein
MTTKRTTVVGVFRDSPMAELAIEVLKDTGFTDDEILYSGVTEHGDFFEALMRWSTGEKPNTRGEVEKNLTGIGLSEDEADYYAREYAAGHPIVAVRAPGREDSARIVICGSGAINREECVEPSEDVPHAETEKI